MGWVLTGGDSRVEVYWIAGCMEAGWRRLDSRVEAGWRRLDSAGAWRLDSRPVRWRLTGGDFEKQ